MTTSSASVKHRVATVGAIQLHYQIAGEQHGGDPLVLLHGWPQHSHMWHRVLPALAEYYTVIAPDLRGCGGSTITPTGYDKRTLAEDIAGLIEQLGYERINLVGYDKGAGVAYTYAAAHPERVRRLAFMEYALPGFGVWEHGMTPSPEWHNGVNWHTSFFMLPDVAEAFMSGQERKLLSWFFWHLSANPDAVSPEDFELYVRQLTKPGALRAGMSLYASVWTDGEHNRETAQHKLTMPVLGVGGEASGGAHIAKFLDAVATNVRPAVLAGAGHWLCDEQPAALAELLLDFFNEQN